MSPNAPQAQQTGRAKRDPAPTLGDKVIAPAKQKAKELEKR